MKKNKTIHTNHFLAVIIHSLLILLLFNPSFAEGTSKSDSLLNDLDSLEGKEKLKTLIKLTQHLQFTSPDSGNLFGLTALRLARELDDIEGELNTINTLANLMKNNGLYDSALFYSNAGIKISKKSGFEKEHANFHYKKGLIYEQQSIYDSSLMYYQIALDLASRQNDTIPIVNAQVDIGYLYYFWGENDSALYYLNKGLDLSEKSNYNLGIGRISVALGNMYYGWKNFEKAIVYYKKAYEIAKKINSKNGIGISLSNIGAAYTDMQNPTEGIKYLRMAVPILQEVKDDDGLANTYLSLGTCFMNSGKFDTAIIYLDRSLEILENHQNKESVSIALYTYSQIYLEKKEFHKSLDFTMQALEMAREINFALMIQRCYKRLADIYQKTGAYQSSIENWIKYDSIKDSIVSENAQKQLMDYETKYKSEKQKKKITILQKDNKIKELKLRRKKWQQNTTFAGLIIVLLVVAGLFYRYIHNKKTTKLLSEKNTQISEQNESLAELNKTQLELIATKDKFFSIIAHDLKSPFNTIHGISDLFYEEFENLSNEEKKNFIMRIGQSANETFNLLENLLEWSYSQTGQLKIEKGKFDLSKIISGTIAVLESQATRKKIDINFENAHIVNVYADVNMARTVLRNLISNAIKFSYPENVIKIQVATVGQFVEVAIHDKGVGIEKKDQDNLFRIDNKIQTKGTANEKGTGLGLILCYEFVTKNGGNISVESEKGKGSKFIFTLPVPK